MNRLPFEKLKGSMDFQKLCAELLIREGVKNVRGLGTGADQGSDLFCEVLTSSALDEEWQRFIIQCKWYSVARTVGEDEVILNYGYLDLHGAIGLLFITSSQFSGTVITKMNALDSSLRQHYKVKLWDGHELTRRLMKYPDLVRRYWYPSDQSPEENSALQTYDENLFFAKFGGMKDIYSTLSINTFPVVPENEPFIANLKGQAEYFYVTPPLVLIVEGSIGSGKTGYVWGLLNQKRQSHSTVAEISPFYFNLSFISYRVDRDMEFISLSKFLREVDFLLLDNLDFVTLDESTETGRAFIQELVDLIQDRINLRKTTIIIAVSIEKLQAPTLSNYLEFLKRSYSSVFLGTFDLRRIGSNNEVIGDQQGVAEKGQKEKWTILGKDWLIEKYQLLESDIEQAEKILLLPKDIDDERRAQWREISGERWTREEELLGYLQHAKGRIEKYSHFIEELNFHALIFRADGSVELRERYDETEK